MVKFESVTKKFGSKTVLEDISFEIEAGELAFVTGPSGAGKTTIIRLLLRELRPEKGHIVIDGKDIGNLRSKDLPLYRRQIGVVFQDFKLLSDRTVFENIALGLAVRGINDRQEVEKKVKEALSDVGLEDSVDHFPSQLAGGQLQRVVLARALVGQPKLILADEPTGNLDPVTARQIVDILDRVAKEGTTVIMATHNAEIVNKYSRHVVKLSDGKIASDRKKGHYEE